MKWHTGLILISALLTLGGCSYLGEAIYRGEMDDLKNQPAEVAYEKLQESGTFKSYAYQSIGVDPDRIRESIKEAADRNLQVNNTPARAFDEMVDELSQRLATTIPSNPQVRASSNLKAMAVGKFKNETGIPGGNISYVVESVAGKLLNNQGVTNEFAVIGVDANTRNEILTEIAGPNYDQVFQNADGSNFRDVKLKKYHPNDIYILSGSAFRLPDYDGGVPRMTMATRVSLEHPRTGETILSEEFKRKYVYHPVRKSWLSEAENDALRANSQESQQPPTQ